MASLSRPLNSWDIVKLIGLLLMFVDHAGAYFLIHEHWLRALGRGSAPIFLFLAGYASSYRFSRELLGLALLMSLSNIVMGIYTSPLNILFSIILCRAVLDWLGKRGKRIEKPWEWFICLLVFTPFTSILFQYGTLGVLFAICGYMKARPDYYPLRTRQFFMAATFVAYAVIYAWLFNLPMSIVLLMALVLVATGLLLWRMDIHPVNTARYPGWLTRTLKLSARYSGHIYAFHLIVISWISGYPI